jgi:hypothetical protein
MDVDQFSEYSGTISHLYTGGTISDLVAHLKARLDRYQDDLAFVLAALLERSEIIGYLLEVAAEMNVRVIPQEIKKELLDSSAGWYSSSSTDCFGLGKFITIPVVHIDMMLRNLPSMLSMARIEESLAHELGHQIQDQQEPLLACMVGLARLPDWDVITFYHTYCPYREARAEEEGLRLIKKFLGKDNFCSWLRQPSFSWDGNTYPDTHQEEMAANRIDFEKLDCCAATCPRLSAISVSLANIEEMIAS